MMTLNKADVQQAFAAAAHSYDNHAVLQRAVADRLFERLDYLRLAPTMILDIGSGTGRCGRMLWQKYSSAQVLSIDMAHTMHTIAQTLHIANSNQHYIQADLDHLPLPDNSVDLIFSNLTLQWCPDIQHSTLEFNRVLKPGGLLLFTSLGPDTLKELRQAWAQVDNYQHVNHFLDMHHVGDALVANEFMDPVVDMEMLTVTYKQLPDLLADLRGIGAHNVNAERRHTLTGKQRFQALTAAYAQFKRPDNLLPASYEIVYGHAWKSTSTHKQHITDGEVYVSVDSLRRRRS